MSACEDHPLLLPQQGREVLPLHHTPSPHKSTYFQNIGEQLWILLDLRAEDTGELNFFLFREGPRACPTQAEKFLKEEQGRNPEGWGVGERRPYAQAAHVPLVLTCTGLWTLR